jgi:hypothetical protein
MAKTVRFSWGGTVTEIERFRVVEADEIGSLQEKMGEKGATFAQQTKACRRILELLHCPPHLIESVYFDEYEALVTSLFAAQMGVEVEGVDPPGNASNAGGESQPSPSGVQ